MDGAIFFLKGRFFFIILGDFIYIDSWTWILIHVYLLIKVCLRLEKMSDSNLKKKDFTELDKPQYNSTLKLIKKLDDIKVNTKEFNLADEQIEKIHEKVNFFLRST